MNYKAAAKTMGVAAERETSKKSVEAEFVNTKSAVAAPKKNKYGI